MRRLVALLFCLSVLTAALSLRGNAFLLGSGSDNYASTVYVQYGATPTASATATATATATLTPTATMTATPPVGLNILAGPYTGCASQGAAGCAKGDMVTGQDATVTAASSTIATSGGLFTAGMVGKSGVVVQYNGSSFTGTQDNSYCAAWGGYGCYTGVSCEFTVASFTDTNHITVTKGAGCGASGIGFAQTGGAYWAIGTNDSTALANALSQAQSNGTALSIPAGYKGMIFSGATMPANVSVQCASGATFLNPHLDTNITYILKIVNTGDTVNGCTMLGTQQPAAPWYDPVREYGLAIQIVTGVNNNSVTTITNNTFQNFWGTYVVGTAGASGTDINFNTFQNCGYYGVQFNETGGTTPTSQVQHNNFSDCSFGSEDGTPNTGHNSQQIISNNTFAIVNTTSGGGNGYNRTQTAVGGFSSGAYFVTAGLSASGSTPCQVGVSGGACTSTQGEYFGVFLQNNTMTGTGAVFYGGGASGQGCGSNLPYGETISGNTCNAGCTCQ